MCVIVFVVSIEFVYFVTLDYANAVHCIIYNVHVHKIYQLQLTTPYNLCAHPMSMYISALFFNFDITLMVFTK